MIRRRVVSMFLVFFTVVLSTVGCILERGAMMPTSMPPEPTATSTPTATPRPTSLNVAVAISPTEGPPGTEVQVTVAGFSPETEIELGVGPENAAYDVVFTRRTDADGSLTAKLAIPVLARQEEKWTVVASTKDGAVRAASDPFQVTAPRYEPEIMISPPDGPPGTEIQVVAQGFPPDTVVEIGVGRENSEYDVVSAMDTGSDGSLTTEAAIPTDAEVGERWVAVVTTEDRSMTSVSNVFQVEQIRYQGTVAISPTSGPPGTRVEVVGRGFPPQAAVEIGIGRVDSEYDVLATAQADADGRVGAQITLPAFVEPEDRWVIVVAAEHRPVKAISDEFDVTRAPTPTASSEDLFTRTNIYLIALGDDGRSGKEIGCDDSVIPVEVEIEPTIAPLTAALEKLLAIESREYGQSGLHNALYRSDLTLDSAKVVENEAVIRLSGTLTLGGVCDEPRVQAQLRKTALQYDTVDRVTIFVNDIPLEELMRGVEN